MKTLIVLFAFVFVSTMFQGTAYAIQSDWLAAILWFAACPVGFGLSIWRYRMWKKGY